MFLQSSDKKMFFKLIQSYIMACTNLKRVEYIHVCIHTIVVIDYTQ